MPEWTNDELNILLKYHSKGTTYLSKMLPERTKTSILIKASRLGLKVGNRKKATRGGMPWTETEDLIVREYYLDDWDTLLKFLPNRTKHAIDQRAQKFGLLRPLGPGRKYTFDGDYFSILDAQRAYWAGFIAADGSISMDGDKYPSVRIEIHSSDIEILERFSRAVNFTGPINSTKGGKYVNVKLFNAPKIVKDLERIYNITPRKSLTLQPPNIADPELIKAFIVGYIDGDGCIRREKQYNFLTLKVVGTRSMLTWIKDFIQPVSKSKSNIRQYERICEFVLGGSTAQRTLQYLKPVPVWKLPRKWDKVPD